jgi:hypothetical protein
MSRLPLETLSIVHAMLPQVEMQQAALTLRMWHHLAFAPDREALFAAFSGDGSQTLLQSFVAALHQRVRAGWPRLRPPPQLCDGHGPMLENAFRLAIADVLGERDNLLVLNAWTLTFHDFWTEMCQITDPPTAQRAG